MSESKAYLETTYGLPVYVRWDMMPQGLYTKTGLKRLGVALPDEADLQAEVEDTKVVLEALQARIDCLQSEFDKILVGPH